jgi:uncharacterized protein (DUF2062 family)
VLRTLYERARALWLQALRENTTPAKVGSSVGLGVFVGCTPFIGFHFAIALGLATLLRLNRVWALVGSRASFFVTLPWIILAEVDIAHRLRTGRWAPLLARDAIDHGREYLLDWWLGVIPVGCALGAALGLLTYLVARRRARLTPRTLSRSPPPTSGSPP